MVGIAGVSSTDLFVGSEQHPLQVQYVRLVGHSTQDTARVTVWIDGDGVDTPEPVTVLGLRAGEQRDVEVAVAVDPRLPEGARQRVTVYAESAGRRYQRPGGADRERPGWTMIMVPHFHFDPFWWNTQAGCLATWDEQPQAAQDGRKPGQAAAFELMRAHLDLARRDPEHEFVLAEMDYLKPFWDAYPQARAELRQLIAGRAGRAGRRHVQRAEHEPDQPGEHHPQPPLRNPVSSGMSSARPRMSAGCSTSSATTRRCRPPWPTPG